MIMSNGDRVEAPPLLMICEGLVAVLGLAAVRIGSGAFELTRS
jgi:hypothetical protein